MCSVLFTRRYHHKVYGLSLLLALVLVFISTPRAAFAFDTPLPPGELIKTAGLVVRGQVLETTGQWADREHGSIETATRLYIRYPIKGEPDAPSLTVYTLGGIIGDLGLRVSDQARFQTGEEVIVFLAQGVDGRWAVVGGEQGRFDIRDGQVMNQTTDLQEPLTAFLQRLTDALRTQGVQPTLPTPAEYISREASALVTHTELAQFISLVSLDGPGRTASDAAAPENFVYRGIHWPGPHPMGEPYLINNNSVYSGAAAGSAADFLNAVTQAGQVWSAVGTANFNLTYGGSTAVAAAQYDGLNVIFWKDTGCPGILGRSSWWYSTATLQIVEVDIELNDCWSWSAINAPEWGCGRCAERCAARDGPLAFAGSR